MAILSLHSQKLWATIASLSKKSRRRIAAIAYVTTDKPIRFDKGDILITDASKHAVASGQTSAQILMRAYKRGARIVSIEHLHAKVMLFDDTTIIGSSNLSNSSQTILLEAAIVTDLPGAVAPVRAFLDNLAQRKPLTELDINRLLKIPIVHHGLQTGKGSRPRIKNTDNSRLWVMGVREVDDERMSPERKEMTGRAREDASSVAGTDIDEICTAWSSRIKFSREVKCGDRVVMLTRKNGSLEPCSVCPPSAVLSCLRHGRYVYIGYGSERWIESRSMTWSKFKVLAKRVSVKVSRDMCREIHSNEALLMEQIWPK